MILQSLVRYYEVLAESGTVSRPGWCDAKVAAALDISIDGELLSVIPLKIKEARGKKEVEVPQMLRVPELVSRASDISPNFLCDNSSYFLGIDTKGKPERSKKCFEAAKQRHLEILKYVESDAAQAVKKFFSSWNPDNAGTNPIITEAYNELCTASNLIFSIDGDYAQEDPDIRKAWENAYCQKQGGEEGVCLVTGEHTEIARIHGLIKGVPGAQSSGASLIGFNAPAYLSYGKEQSYNAPVGQYAVYAYTTALNYLINSKSDGRFKYRSTIGDTIIVYWAEDGSEWYQKVFAETIEPNADNQDLVTGVFQNLEKGWAVDADSVLQEISPEQKFYILGVSPNAARLSVRFFYQDSFGNILRHLKEHYNRMEIVRPAGDKAVYLGTWRMLQEIVNKKSRDKKPPDNIGSAVFRAILEGGRYPVSFYQSVLRRIRSEQDDTDSQIYKITRGRTAIIKAYLLRNTNITEREEITVALNENNRNVPYTLGRMFAVLENIQEVANPGINATIKERYFNSACANPASIFPILLKLKNSHMKKIERERKGYAISFEKKLGMLQDIIPVGDEQKIAYPKQLSLEEQGMFILGYYQQTQQRYEKKEEEEK